MPNDKREHFEQQYQHKRLGQPINQDELLATYFECIVNGYDVSHYKTLGLFDGLESEAESF